MQRAAELRSACPWPAVSSPTWIRSLAALGVLLLAPAIGLQIGRSASSVLVLAGLAAIVLGLGSLRWPASIFFGLLALLALVPADYIPALSPTKNLFDVPWPISPPVAAAVGGAFLVLVRRGVLPSAVVPIGLATGPFVLAAAASLAFTGHDETAGAVWLFQFVCGFLLFLSVSALVHGRALRWLVVWFAVLAALAALYGLVEYVLQENPLYGEVYFDNPIVALSRDNRFYFPGGTYWGTGVYRVTSTLGHPLRNGLLYTAGLLLAFGGMLYARGLARVGLATLSLILAGGLAVTFSRGSWFVSLGLLLALYLHASRARGLRNILLSLPLLLLGGLAVSLLLQDAWQNRLGNLLVAPEVTSRLSYFEDGIETFLERPLLGWGLQVSEARKVGWATYENSWLTLLIDTGLLGLLSFLSLCGFVLLRPFLAGRRPVRLSALQVSTRVAFFGFLLNLYSFNFMSSAALFHSLFWLLVAFVVGADRLADEARQATEARLRSLLMRESA